MSTTSPHILVVDDDPEIRRLLGRYLTAQGQRVSLAADGREMRKVLAAGGVDLVVLDIMLPDGSGLDLCRKLREQGSRVPIVLLTALKEHVDLVIGLELGADDYVGKPFNPRELVARIRAVLRRSVAPDPLSSRKRYRFLDFLVSAETRSVESAGEPVSLTAAEFDLLVVFLEHPGRLLSRDQLFEMSQLRHADPVGRSIDVLVSRLRRKLGDAGQNLLFKTVRNGGYQFTAPVDAQEISS